MKFLIVFVALFAFALAAPPNTQTPKAEVEIQESEVNVDSYKHSLKTSDGTDIKAQGDLKNIGKEQAIVARGSYSWVDPEGFSHTITYTADENGYQPQGADLPVPQSA